MGAARHIGRAGSRRWITQSLPPDGSIALVEVRTAGTASTAPQRPGALQQAGDRGRRGQGNESLPSDPTLLKTCSGLTQGSEAYNASRLTRAATSGSPGATNFLEVVKESGGQPASLLVAADASGASSLSRLQGVRGCRRPRPLPGFLESRRTTSHWEWRRPRPLRGGRTRSERLGSAE